MSNKCTQSECFHYTFFCELQVTNAETIKEFQGYYIVILEKINILFNQHR